MTVASLELQMARLGAERGRLTAAMSVLQAARESWQEQAERLGEECAALKETARATAVERQKLQDRWDDLEERLVVVDAERSRLEREFVAQATRAGELHEVVNRMQAQVNALQSSWSWRITSPLRRAADVLGIKVPSGVR